MPISREKGASPGHSSLGITELLDKVNQIFLTGLESSNRGNKVIYARDILLSLVLVRVFQSALGRTQECDSNLVCNILG